MNDNLITLNFKKPIYSWLIIMLVAIGCAILLNQSATTLEYRILTLCGLCIYSCYLSYCMLFNSVTKCDLLTLIDTAIVWHGPQPYKSRILAIQAIGRYLISISLDCAKPKQLLIFPDSLNSKQYKQLMRLIRWK